MARKPTSNALRVARLFEPVREQEQPWVVAFESLLTNAREDKRDEPDDAINNPLVLSGELIEQGG